MLSRGNDSTRGINWEKPDLNWFNLNIDGSSIGNPGKAGGGGIIRNQHVNWIRGFARSIGIASSVVAEL